MKVIDIFLVLLIVLAVVFALRTITKKKKNGGCGCGCGSCAFSEDCADSALKGGKSRRGPSN